MSEYTLIPGSGEIRVTTPTDVENAKASLTASANFRNRKPKALVASAMQIDAMDSAYQTRMALGWQERALQYINLIPELNYASRFYARMMQALRIYPAKLDEKGNAKAIETGLPVELLDAIQGPGGGRAQLQAAYGRLQFITGEGYLFGRDTGRDTWRWLFVWNDEIAINQSTGTLIWTPYFGGKTQEFQIGQNAQAYRFWTPHPGRSGEADSPMRSAVEGLIAEELIALTRTVRSTAVSRLLNGVIILPSELSFGAEEPGLDDDPEANPFIKKFVEHISGVVENAGSAEAATPFVLEIANEFAPNVRWERLHDPATDYLERDLRTEAVGRLAHGMDLPPEVLTGLGLTNHWAAKQIIDDMYKSHGAPVAARFCEDLNDAYLRPALEKAEYPDWDRVVLLVDPTEVMVRPDRSDDANEAWDRGAIGWPALRRSKGFTEDDKMTDPEEIAIWEALKLRDPTLIPGNDQVVPPAAGATPSGDNTNPSNGPPQPGPNGVSRQDGMKIIGAAEMALRRCREMAGARIRRFDTKCHECLERADGKPNMLVAALIGPENLARLGTPEPLKLVEGGSDGFRSLLQDTWGIPDAQATALSQMVEMHAARTIFDSEVSELPSGFEAHVMRIRELVS